MVTTRSQTKRQGADEAANTQRRTQEKSSAGSRPNKKLNPSESQDTTASLKRKCEDRTETRSPSRAKHPTFSPDAAAYTILINRSPVLRLWSATIAHFLHPSLPWSTCLSAGSAIAGLCAVAKGRSIGTIEPADPAKKRERRKEKEDEEEVEVMKFRLRVRDGLVVTGGEGKAKAADEGGLRRKFGEEGYEQAKRTFEEAINTWKGHEDELNETAFGFYEAFRPEVRAGQKGWGRKGELNLGKVRDVVIRS